MALDLTQLKGLFFDIYATLIDWEAGIVPQLIRLGQQSAITGTTFEDTPEHRASLLDAFHNHSKAVEHENPTLPFPQVLERVYERIAEQIGVKISQKDQIAFGQSIGDWPAYADTVKAMQVLAKFYKLFVLSNVDNASFERTRTGPLKGVHWDGIYTAEMIGSYKPDPRNFQYVVDRAKEDFLIDKSEMVLVAQSLDIDHIATKALGFKPGVWIARSGSSMGGKQDELEQQGLIELGAVYETLGDMAEAVQKAFSDNS